MSLLFFLPLLLRFLDVIEPFLLQPFPVTQHEKEYDYEYIRHHDLERLLKRAVRALWDEVEHHDRDIDEEHQRYEDIFL